MAKLTPRQAAFVAEYLVDLNATRSAIKAGYSAKTAESQGSRLLSNVKVREEIEAALKRRADRVEVKAEDILRELLTFARTDVGKAFDEAGNLLPVHQMPEEVRRAISGIDVEELWEGRGEDREHVGNIKKIRFWDKVRGLELLGKHLRLFTDRMEHTGPGGGGLVIMLPPETPEE